MAGKILVMFLLVVNRGTSDKLEDYLVSIDDFIWGSTQGISDESTTNVMVEATTMMPNNDDNQITLNAVEDYEDDSTTNVMIETTTMMPNNDDNQIALNDTAVEDYDPISSWLELFLLSLSLGNISTCNHTIENKLDHSLLGVEVEDYLKNIVLVSNNNEIACITSNTLARDMLSRIEGIQRYLEKSKDQKDEQKLLKLTKIRISLMVKRILKMLKEIKNLINSSKNLLHEVDEQTDKILETLRGNELSDGVNNSSLNEYSLIENGTNNSRVTNEQLRLLKKAKEYFLNEETLIKQKLQSVDFSIECIQNEKENLDKNSSEFIMKIWIPIAILEQVKENCRKYLVVTSES